MPKYRVLSSGKYTKIDRSLPVTVDSFVLAENEEEGRFLMLRFRNRKNTRLSRLSVKLFAYSRRGELLETINIEEEVNANEGRFVLNKTIKVPFDCVNFSVEITAAEFGKYLYTINGGTVSLGYVENEKRVLYDASVQKSSMGGKDGVTSVRRLNSPLAICILAIILIACAAVFLVFNIEYFKENSDGFREDGVLYEFVTDGNGEYEGITVTGYVGMTKSATIPSEIGGYRVLSISSGAFSGSGIKSLTIQSDVAIESFAFSNCTSLTQLDISNVTYIGEYAFSGCTALKTVTIDCGESTLTLSRNSFANCYALKTISITSPTEYPSDGSVFTNCSSVESLSIYNLNTDENDSFTIYDLFGGSDVANLKNISINHLGYISSDTFSGLGIESLSVNILDVADIPDYAFYNCSCLTTLTLPVKITSAGTYAFCNCAVQSLDLSQVQSLGSYAFYESGIQVADFSVNTALTEIDEYTFYGCYNLTAVKLPYNCKNVGKYAFYMCNALTDLTMYSSLTTVNAYAFKYCSSLLALALPKNVTTIGTEAFSYCSSLASLSFSGNPDYIYDYAFSGCSAITSITLPELGYTGYGIFSGCDSVKKITFARMDTSLNDYFDYNIPQTLATVSVSDGGIPSDAFYGGGNITKVTLPSGITTIPTNAFTECYSLATINIPDTVQSIEEFAFAYCTSLTELTLPSALTYIGYRAFNYCTVLKFVQLPSALTYIDNAAFEGCYKLREVLNYSSITVTAGSEENGMVAAYAIGVYTTSLQRNSTVSTTYNNIDFMRVFGDWYVVSADGVSSLGFTSFTYSGKTVNEYAIAQYAFYNNSSVNTADLGSCVTTIGAYAFYNCYNLSQVNFGSSVTYIGECSFSNCSSLTSLNISCDNYEIGPSAFYVSGLKTAYFSGGLSSVGQYAFAECYSLTDIGLYPQQECVIDAYAFNNDYNISVLNLNNITEISNYAFYGCTSLTVLGLPDTLYYIGRYAFADCSELGMVYFYSSPEIGTNAFSGCTSLYEVFDLCYMGITAGSTNNGKAGYYALCVYNSLDEERRVATSGDYLFYKDGSWNLYQYTGTGGYYTTLSLPYSFETPDGNVIYSYGISDYAFSGTDVNYLVINDNISTISRYAFDGMGYSYICYKGTQSGWSNICSASVTPCYYTDCVHEYGYWTYDSYGNIITDVSTREEVVAEATCIQEGEYVVVCNVCGEILERYYTGYDIHYFDEDGTCTVCGLQGEVLTGDNYQTSEYFAVTNDETYSFVYENGAWHSSNTDRSTLSSFTITATQDVTIYLNLSSSAKSADRIYVIVNYAYNTDEYEFSGSNAGVIYVITLLQGESLTIEYQRANSAASSVYDNCVYIDMLVAFPYNEQ